MKTVILNSSGNVGKSTITKEFLYPRLENALIIEIETVNSSNINNNDLNVINFNINNDAGELYLSCIENENVLVDIGASNLSGFFEKILDFDGFLDIFDYFVIPTVSTIKETEDTIKTINFLQNVGIEDEKIKVIPNKVKKDVKAEFAILFKNSPIEINQDIFIKDSKLFSNLALLKTDIKSIFRNDLDHYKDEILKAETPQDKMRLIKMDMSNRMAHTIIKNFDEMFFALFGQSPKQMEIKSEPKEEIIVKSHTRKKPSKKAKESTPVEEELNLDESEDF